MKAYRVLIKQRQSEIDLKQKDISRAHQDKLSLEHQIEYMKESLEREHIASARYKQFLNPKYFERTGNKIEAYMHLLRGKDDEIEKIQDEVRELFADRKKYDVLLQKIETEAKLARLKQEAESLEDLYRPNADD